MEREGTERVTLLLDSDEAGRSAAEKLLPVVSRSFFTKVVDLPNGEEPDTASEGALRNLAEPVAS